MKKGSLVIAWLGLLIISLPVVALNPAQVERQVSQTQLAPINQAQERAINAIDHNKKVTFTILETLWSAQQERADAFHGFDAANGQEYWHGTPIAHPKTPTQIACKIYVLHKHWLIASGTCMRPYEGNINYRGRDYEAGASDRKIQNSFHVGKYSILSTKHAENSHVMLLWSDSEIATDDEPAVLVLGSSSADKLKNYTLKINTARYGTNKVTGRSIKTAKGNGFTLNEDYSFSGTATDPIFAIKKSGTSFLAGFNNGWVKYGFGTYDESAESSGDKSPNWFSLTKDDLNFIKNTVLKHRKQDWEQIKYQLYYDDLNAPYFL